MRIIKIVIIVLLTLIFALFAIRFLFLDQIVNYSLQKIGAEAVSIHISDMNWTELRIDSFSATYILEGGDKYSVNFHDISLHYDLPEILTSRKSSRVEIEEMTIHRVQKILKPETSFVLPDHIELLNDELRANLPLDNLSIKHLQFQGDFPSQLLDKNIELNTSIENKAIQAELYMALAPNTRLSIDLQSSDSFHGVVKIVLLKQDSEIAAVKLLLQPESLTGTIRSQAEAMLDVLLQSGVLEGLPECRGSLLLDFDVPLSSTMEKLFSVKATLSDSVFQGLTASKIQLQLFGRLAGEKLFLDAESNFQTENLYLGKNSLEKLFVSLNGSFRKQNEQFLFELSDQHNLQIKGFVTEKAEIAELNVHFDKPIQLFFQKDALSMVGGGLRFDPMQIQEGERIYDIGGLNCSEFELEKSGTDFELFTAYSLPAVVIDTKGQQLPLKELSGTVQLKNRHLVGKLQFSPEELPARMQANFEHDLDISSGSLKIKTDRRINLDGTGDSLANLLTSWAYPFNLDGGKVAFKADGAWNSNEKMELSAFVSVTEGRGYYKQVLFNGLNVRQDLAVLPVLYSKTKGSFALKQLIGGIDAYDIRTDVNLLATETGPLPQVQINDFSASLFDGSVSSDEVNYDLNMPDSKFFVDVEAMDLGQLVGLINMNSLYVSGLISGSIPVRIKGKDISVESGKLHSDEPGGEIRYTPGNMNQAGLTAYALKAVKELQYQTLQVIANYQPSGQLDLDIGLKGVSPGLETRRPVHLNIHAEQNLPALLQSLRFSKGLTEELDKRVKQHYN